MLIEERTFFFFFLLFKTTEICFGSTKMGIFYREKAFHVGKKIRKNDFAPSVKYFSYTPAWSWTIMYKFTHCVIFCVWFDRMKEQCQEKVTAVLNVYQYEVSLWLKCVSVITRDWLLKFAEEHQIVLSSVRRGFTSVDLCRVKAQFVGIPRGLIRFRYLGRQSQYLQK